MSDKTPLVPLPKHSSGRCVTQFHQWQSGDHYDLMLETGPRLATWRSRTTLTEVTTTVAPLERTPDHRSDYLTYEGPVSGNRGIVRIVERGRFTLTERQPGVYDLVVTLRDKDDNAAHHRFVLSCLSDQWIIVRQNAE